jgi:hypothetical protein
MRADPTLLREIAYTERKAGRPGKASHLEALAKVFDELARMSVWWQIDQSVGDAEEANRPNVQIEARKRIAAIFHELVPPE